MSPLLCSPLCSPLCGPLCSPSADRSATPQRSIVCAYRTHPAQGLHTQCPPCTHTGRTLGTCTRPPFHPPTPPRSWFLVLPAAVGFAAVLLLLLYSACLVETVDDEAILGLLTILPTYCPLWRYILSLAVHTMAIYLLCLRLLQALLGLVRRGIGVDEAQIQDLASNLADQLEAYRALSDQIDKALARRPAPPRAAATLGTLHPHTSLPPHRWLTARPPKARGTWRRYGSRMHRAAACKTRELGADPPMHTHLHLMPQVARKLATNLTANKQSEFATDTARAHASDTVYHKVFKLLSQVSKQSLASDE